MRTSKPHKVVMLPTEKAELGFNNKGELVTGDTALWSNDAHKAQELYILSDDEIKEGDWHIDLDRNTKHKSSFPDGLPPFLKRRCKKIVATTDKSIIVDKFHSESKMIGGQLFGINSTKYLPQIPESFLTAYIKAYNEGKPITEVDLEMDGDESPAWSGMWKYWPKTRPDNTVIVHQSKMYSKDEVEKAFQAGIDHEANPDRNPGFDTWIDNL